MSPAELRDLLQAGLERRGPDALDGDLAATLVGYRQPFPGMRVEALGWRMDGTCIYGVTVQQARRLLHELDRQGL